MPAPEIPRTLIAQVENWGYFLLPPSHPESPGYTGLLVAMRATPTGKHFDPEALLLHLVGADGRPEAASFDRHPTFSMTQRVTIGEIKLSDRLGKVVEFYTFGGSLEALTLADETIYSLRSPAPIFFLTPVVDSPSVQLVSEVQVQLNALRAQWGTHASAFEQRLAATQPQTLYKAALQSLLGKYTRSQALHDTFMPFYKMLLQEAEWLKTHDAWNDAGPTLEELFRQ